MKNHESIVLKACSEFTRLVTDAVSQQASGLVWIDVSGKDGHLAPLKTGVESRLNLTNERSTTQNVSESHTRLKLALQLLKESLELMRSQSFTGSVRISLKMSNGNAGDPCRVVTTYHR